MSNASTNTWLRHWIEKMIQFAADVQCGDAAMSEINPLTEELLEQARSDPSGGTALLHAVLGQLKFRAQTAPAAQAAAIDMVVAAITTVAEELESEMRTK
jgi:hypothetical protein